FFIVLSILVLCRQSSSPLFPYTTLFRSEPAGKRVRGVGGAPGKRPSGAGKMAARDLVQLPDGEHPERLFRRQERDLFQVGTTGTDRKSTRLNSSHVQISYAVFCLKKKIG